MSSQSIIKWHYTKWDLEKNLYLQTDYYLAEKVRWFFFNSDPLLWRTSYEQIFAGNFLCDFLHLFQQCVHLDFKLTLQLSSKMCRETWLDDGLCEAALGHQIALRGDEISHINVTIVIYLSVFSKRRFFRGNLFICRNSYITKFFAEFLGVLCS